MGVLRHNDLYSTKYINAEISDSEDRLHVFPIKHTLGDYFITELDNNLFAFTLRGARILTRRVFGTKTLRIIQYDTSNYKAVDAGKLKALELMLKKNMLPRMNMIQFSALKILGRKETREKVKRMENVKAAINSGTMQVLENDKGEPPDFKPHDINVFIDEVAARKKDFPEEATNMERYLKNLDIDEIVTPVRKITEFIEDDLIATEPSFLGELLPRFARLDNEHKAITNKPVGTGMAWLKPVLLILMIAMIVVVIYFAYDMGAFDQIINSFPDPSTFANAGTGLSALSPAGQIPNPTAAANQCSDAVLQAKYSPEALKIAIDNGSETCKLSPTMQSLVDSVETPKVTPKN